MSSVPSTPSPEAWSTSPSWRRRSRSSVASTTEAPSTTASRAWAGPPSAGHRARAGPALTPTRTVCVPSGGTRPLETTSTALRSATAAPIWPTAAGSAEQGTASTTRSTPANSMSATVQTRTERSRARRRAGSAPSSRAPRDALGLGQRTAAELHVEAGALEQHGERRPHRAGSDHRGGAQRREAAEPLPLELHAGPDPLGHLGARGSGKDSSTRGKVSARPKRRLHLDRPDPPAAAASVLGAGQGDRDDRRAALEREAADPAPRLAERARANPRALGEDHRPRRRARGAQSEVRTESSSDSPRRTGNAPRQFRNQPWSRLSKSSFFATK